MSGINYYKNKTKSEPIESKYMNADMRDWTLKDVLKVGRFFSIDYNFILYFAGLSPKLDNGTERLFGHLLKVRAYPAFLPLKIETYQRFLIFFMDTLKQEVTRLLWANQNLKQKGVSYPVILIYDCSLPMFGCWQV